MAWCVCVCAHTCAHACIMEASKALLAGCTSVICMLFYTYTVKILNAIVYYVYSNHIDSKGDNDH